MKTSKMILMAMAMCLSLSVFARQVGSDTVKTQTKTVKMEVKTVEDVQNLLKMLGGGQVTTKDSTGVKVRYTPPNKGVDKKRSPMLGKSVLNQKAPELVLLKWLTEEPKTDGKFVILARWGTHCAPCIKLIPKYNEWNKMFKEEMVIIGLADDDSETKDFGIEYYRGIDRDTFEPIGLRVLCHMLLVDPKGIVRWEGDCNHLSTEELKAIMAKYKSEDGQRNVKGQQSDTVSPIKVRYIVPKKVVNKPKQSAVSGK